MSRGKLSAVFAFLFVCSGTPLLKAQAQDRRPLKDRELMALVSGGTLSENVAHEISSRGLDFQPDEAYEKLLTSAGADEATIKAVAAARVAENHDSKTSGAAETDPLLQEMSTAGSLIRSKQLVQALEVIREIRDDQSNGAIESAFVAGALFVQQGDWLNADTMYENIVQRDPYFPQAHTKLSFVLYSIGDNRGALQQAELALVQNQKDPEAHKNAGLAMRRLGDSEAADREFQEAVRLKPGYKFGTESPAPVTNLDEEAKALRALGRGDEAEKIERRKQLVQSADGQLNQPAPPPSAYVAATGPTSLGEIARQLRAQKAGGQLPSTAIKESASLQPEN